MSNDLNLQGFRTPYSVSVSVCVCFSHVRKYLFAGAMTITDLGLWGNYSVPGDNPFSEDKELQPEIWALGFRNPWRCSFDLERPPYFLCADVGQVRDSN